MKMSNTWKFSSLPSEINLHRIVCEASESLNDQHSVIRLTIGRQVFTLCTFAKWQERAPGVKPLGLVTRFTEFRGEPDALELVNTYPAFFGNPDAVVVFNMDLVRKLRGGVETRVEVF